MAKKIRFTPAAEATILALLEQARAALPEARGMVPILGFPLRAIQNGVSRDHAADGGPLVSLGLIAGDKLADEDRTIVGATAIAVRFDARFDHYSAVVFDAGDDLTARFS